MVITFIEGKLKADKSTEVNPWFLVVSGVSLTLNAIEHWKEIGPTPNKL